MEFDFAALSEQERYKLMSAVILPRPIAWITSQSAAGVRNAAPYSFFNMMGAEPPIVAIGAMRRPDGSRKDSPENILSTGEFVVNLVTLSDAARMNFTCIDAPPDFDEIEAGNLYTLPSTGVTPPRIASAPVSMECRLMHSHEAGKVTVMLGEVVRFHIADAFVDPERFHVDTLALNLIARMHSGGWYARPVDLFSLERPAFAQWSAPKS